MTNLNKQNGERKLDNSSRFSKVKANTLADTISELVDNQLTYGETYGEISYEVGLNGAKWVFTNDATTENLPSFETMKAILACAGESISSKFGVSLKGEGIELVALSARKRYDSISEVNIEVCREHLRYCSTMVYDGRSKIVHTSCDSNPIPTDKSNSFKITIENTNQFTEDEYEYFKHMLSIKLWFLHHTTNPNFKLYLKDDNGRVEVKDVDMFYKKELKGTDLYLEREFSFENRDGETETIRIVCSNVHDVIRTDKANVAELDDKANPNFSGIYFIAPNGVAVTIGGADSFKLIKRGNERHNTKNAIRVAIYGGWSLFKHLYVESSVKRHPSTSLIEFKDTFGDDIVFYNENLEECTITDICAVISGFISKAKTGQSKTITETDMATMFDSFSEDELRIALKVIREFNSKSKVSTLEDILEKKILKNNEVSLFTDAE